MLNTFARAPLSAPIQLHPSTKKGRDQLSVRIPNLTACLKLSVSSPLRPSVRRSAFLQPGQRRNAKRPNDWNRGRSDGSREGKQGRRCKGLGIAWTRLEQQGLDDSV